MDTVTLTVELTKEQAYYLALFVKRCHYGVCQRLADPTNKTEPDEMMSGICAVQRGLREIGYAPR